MTLPLGYDPGALSLLKNGRYMGSNKLLPTRQVTGGSLTLPYSIYSYKLQFSLRHADGFTHSGNCALFQSGNLRLRDAQSAGHLHLGLSVVKPQGKNLLLTGL